MEDRAMITPKIAANQAFSQLNRIHKYDDEQRQHAVGGKKTSPTAGDAVDAVKAQFSVFSTHPLQQFNTEFNSVVKSIRIADQAMAEIGANIEQMESEVQMFVKQYPPYPPGNEERLQILNRFAALRKQIDRLTFPPDPFAQKIIGDSGSGDKAQAWDISFGDRTLAGAIRRQPMHTGSEGINLPEMPVDASDQDIADLQAALRRAWETVAERRGHLADDAKKMIGQVEKLG
jgi:hypothetical protein